MFLFRIILAGALVLGVLIFVKQDRLLQRSGLVGYCQVVASPAGDTSEWRACREGKLEGRPNLGMDSCESRAIQGRIEFWRCPAPIAAGHKPQ
ncbi:MAG: hypothetical protein QOE36_223 [Gaiellaceae bacterium]|jgi:hypothetical protein|nr:hypothetical protein [Gaiellaceae bacterium]